MFTLKSAAILALLGSAFAAPLAHRDTDNTPEFGRYTKKIVSVVPADASSDDTTKIVYVVGTANDSDDDDTQVTTHTGHRHGSGHNQGSDSSSSSGADTTTSTGTGSADTSASGSADASAGTGSQTGYMAIVSKYRAAGGLPALTQSSKLEANALKTAQDGNGQMVHELNPGTFGQVLAPGTADNFEHVYVGGWLCERPELKGLNGICASMTKGWSHDGQTGHADILSDSKYKNIGCALADGIWACDVA